MKFQVGDLLFIKDCKFVKHNCAIASPIGFMEQSPAAGRRQRLCWEYDIYDFFGIITKVIKHMDAWSNRSTPHDDVYILYSQLDGKESYFFADEVTVELPFPNNTMLSI